MTRLTTYQPTIYRNNIFDLVDSFFNDQRFSDRSANTLSTFTPRVDVIEKNDAYHFHVMVPGIKKEDLKIRIEDGLLRIKGERKEVQEDEGVKIHRIESSYGSFERVFRLPDDVKEENLTAKYEDGVLSIEVAKEEKKVAREIEIL